MVRAGEWEVRLAASAHGPPLPEVTAGGRTYAVAAPGESFFVQVTRHPGYFIPDGAHRQVSLFVDGVGVGYSKIFALPATAAFEGFLERGDAHARTCRAFVFSKPVETDAKQATGLNFVEGKIKVVVHRAMYTGVVEPNRQFAGPANTNESVARLPEGKKFFMAPSLTTGKGEKRQVSGFSTQTSLVLDQCAEVELRYETAATLLLRGVLKREVPEHRAILQRFPDTAEQDGGAGPSQATVALSGGQGRKRQGGQAAAPARVKRERQGQREAELVDLTQAFNEKDEVLAARRADQVLECDLTREEAPEWRARQRGAANP